jgi:hypothetical protein
MDASTAALFQSALSAHARDKGNACFAQKQWEEVRPQLGLCCPMQGGA